MAATAKQAIRNGERQPGVKIENADPDERLNLEQRQVRGAGQRFGEFRVRNRRELGHLQAKLHAQKERKPGAKVANKILMEQSQPAQLGLGQKRRVAKIVRLDLRGGGHSATASDQDGLRSGGLG